MSGSSSRTVNSGKRESVRAPMACNSRQALRQTTCLRTETSPCAYTVCTGLLIGRCKVHVPSALSISNLGRGLKYLAYGGKIC